MSEFARMTMPFLYAIAALRLPVFTELMGLLTYFGDAVLFVVVGVIAYWCWDKRGGEYVLMVGLGGTVIGHFLKNMCRVPRPWVLDENFTIVESARARATGYSFPSGHTQVGVGLYGSIAAWAKDKRLRAIGIAMAIVIPFSRMLLGVHTPLDIGAATLISLVFIFVLKPVFESGEKQKRMAFAVMTAGSIVLLVIAALTMPTEGEAYELALEGVKTLCMCSAAIAALWLGHEVDARYTHWETKGSLKIQVLKTVPGLLGVLALYLLVHFIPATLVPLRFVGYFVAIGFATTVWPMTFRWISSFDK